MDYSRSIRILTQEDLIKAGCFNFKEAIAVCEKTLKEYAKGNIIFPDKISVIFDQASQSRINCMPAGLKNEMVYGMKWVSVFPNNPHQKNVPNLAASILISDMDTGFPIAFMESSMLSNMRTAAMSAVAAKYLAAKSANSIGFIGGGDQAKSHFLAMKEVVPAIQRCYVSSRTTKTVSLFIDQMMQFYPRVEYIACGNDYEKAVKEADIIVTAISGQKKILQADWIKKGVFYAHVGGIEDDYGVVKKADKIVCDEWRVVKRRSQTISQMYQAGMLDDKEIYADLYEIVNEEKTGRASEDEFVYYNGVGMSYIDVAIGNWAYERAIMGKIGTEITMIQESMYDSKLLQRGCADWNLSEEDGQKNG